MAKYITKPIVIEAEQFNIEKWLKAGKPKPVYSVQIEGKKNAYDLMIDTRQRSVKVFDGDFIIKLADGETYPCNPEVFHNKYEPIKEN
jgi:hypothetical protein